MAIPDTSPRLKPDMENGETSRSGAALSLRFPVDMVDPTAKRLLG